MQFKINSLRTFIGSINFETSRHFYQDIGFTEVPLSNGFSLFRVDELSFYLQDHYVKDWMDNTMLFIEVTDVEHCFQWLQQLQLEQKYPGVKLLPIKSEGWGAECFLIDPAGVLLHFGQFH
jgi:hypothetical protein